VRPGPHAVFGSSWIDVWALDFYGFSCSDRYREMDVPAESNPPLCLAEDGTAQLAAAVRFILEHQGRTSLSLIAHSWGSVVAGRFAGDHPMLVDRLVLFAPIARKYWGVVRWHVLQGRCQQPGHADGVSGRIEAALSTLAEEQKKQTRMRSQHPQK
jgi:pimeloyl-ACP methyl ester carboxylesterase